MLNVVELVLKFVAHRKLRSFLTTLGIAIGVALVFSLVSINRGMVTYISSTLDELGSNLVIIMPKNLFTGGGLGTYFTKDQVEALGRLYFVDKAVGFSMASLPVEIRGEEFYLSILGSEQGLTKDFGDMASFKIERGRDFTSNDRKKLVIGYTIADEYNLGPGSQVKIEGENYRIIGVMAQIGNRQDDSQVYMNIKDIEELTGQENYIVIYLQTTEPKVDEIKRTLKRLRNREDFEVSTTADLLDTVNQVLGVLNAVFMAVASISILVGSVGVANTMYMAVAERTREIGIMKAVGAGEMDILTIFLLESGLLSLVGGMTGALLGYGLAVGVSYIATTLGGFSGLKPVFTLDLLMLSALMAFVVGILAGIFPARYASKLEPVQALRYE